MTLRAKSEELPPESHPEDSSPGKPHTLCCEIPKSQREVVNKLQLPAKAGIPVSVTRSASPATPSGSPNTSHDVKQSRDLLYLPNTSHDVKQSRDLLYLPSCSKCNCVNDVSATWNWCDAQRQRLEQGILRSIHQQPSTGTSQEVP